MFKFETLDVWKKTIDLYERVSLLLRGIDQKDQFSLGETVERSIFICLDEHCRGNR
jgi:hypothetical protein